MSDKIQEMATFYTRVASVQCSYSVIFSGEKLSQAVLERFSSQEFLRDIFDMSGDVLINMRLFVFLVRGIIRRRAEIDLRLGELLRVPVSKNDPLFVGILRAGAFELLYRPNVPRGAVISEYVKIAEAFLVDSKIATVNAVLDNVKPSLAAPIDPTDS